MKKEEYIKITNENLTNESKKLMLKQINNYYESIDFKINYPKYNIGDEVKLTKCTLLHGTFKNLDGLKEIVKNGLISSWFTGERLTKYPSSVGVWKIKQDCLLKDYINFYSGGTIEYKAKNGQKIKTSVISYSKMKNIMNTINNNTCFRWYMEQTKEARFLPSLVQNEIQIGIIFNGNNKAIKKLLKGDILDNSINDKIVQEFVNPDYYERFIIERKNKDDFFTNRESAILFGIPSNFIEGILVGKKYENNYKILKEIKKILPHCYICNLKGLVIY